MIVVVRRFGHGIDDTLECIQPERKLSMNDVRKRGLSEEKGRGILESGIEQALKGFLYEKKKMFGCPAFFAHGSMFAGVYRNSIFIRLNEDDRARLAEVSAEIKPFEPLPGRIMRQYMAIPDVLCGEEHFVREWLNRSYSYAMSLPSKEKPARPRKKRS